MKLKKVTLSFLLFLFISINSPYLLFSESFQSKVTPIDNKNYFSTSLSLLKKSQKSIYVIMFSARYYSKYPDSPSNQILNELIKAAKRNVKVEIILDQSELKFYSSNTKGNLETANYLSNNGITVYFDSIKKTTHSKLIIIDEKYVILGSTNWSYYSLTKNNETSVLINSPELAEHYIKYFGKMKRECKTKLTPK